VLSTVPACYSQQKKYDLHFLSAACAVAKAGIVIFVPGILALLLHTKQWWTTPETLDCYFLCVMPQHHDGVTPNNLVVVLSSLR
jgi:hypothetical protein